MFTLLYIRVVNESWFLLLYVLFIYDFQLYDTVQSPGDDHLFVKDIENFISENTH